MTKYDVFNLLHMTSNVSSFVCFSTDGAYFLPSRPHFFVWINACDVLHVVVCHVLLCAVCHCSSATFLCDIILMEESSCIPQDCLIVPTWIAPDTPVRKACSSDEECSHFSDSDIGLLLCLCLLCKQRQQSDCGGYLSKESFKHCTQPLLQAIHMSILVAAYHCVAGKLNDPPSWVARSLRTCGTL